MSSSIRRILLRPSRLFRSRAVHTSSTLIPPQDTTTPHVPASVPSSSQAQSQASQESSNSRPYYVPRTENGHLPVYSDFKSGGTRRLTVLRKIDGDTDALRRAMSSAFGPEVKMTSDPKLGRITVNGNQLRVEDVKEWLETEGF